jgi:hypothetical protein
MEIKNHMPIAYARRLATQVAQYLKIRYGAKRVVLLGSLASGLFNPDFSGIRVGFDGVEPDLEKSAITDCRFHFGNRDPDGISRLDVVSLTRLSPKERDFLARESEEI